MGGGVKHIGNLQTICEGEKDGFCVFFTEIILSLMFRT